MKLIFFFLLANLVCSNISEKCITDKDCLEENYCHLEKCRHKSIFPLDINDLIGFLSILLGSAISNAGGIGGGGLYIPSLIIWLKFYTHEAIPISKLMVFVGAITAFIINLKLKHPSRQTTAIDYNISLLIVPFLLYGTVIGVLLNQILPSLLIISVLTLVLLFNTYKTIRRAILIYQAENEEKLLTKEKSINLKEMKDFEPSLEVKKDNQIKLNKNLIRLEISKDKRIFQWEKLTYLVLSYISMILLSLLRGSDKMHSLIGVEKCSVSYWILLLAYIPIGLLITIKAAKSILSENKYRLEIGFPYDKNDIMWRQDLLYKFPIFGFFAGTIAGSVGIGGGLLLGPLLIELGINPVISTVTSNFLVLFTSSSTSLQFSLAGMMNINYGGICTFFSMSGSLIGTLTLHYILIIFKRESILVFVLVLVLVISSIILPIYSIMQISKGDKFLEFSSFC